MELSLQRKVNAKKVFHRRKEMIDRENLHIDDDISYEQFSKLYEKYGKDMDEKDFARYFFDLYYEEWYKFQSGKIRKSRVLTREFVTEQEILEIKTRTIEAYHLSPDEPIEYEPIVQIYEEFGERLSFYLFAEKILNVTKHILENKKSQKNKKPDQDCKIKVLQSERLNKKILEEIQGQVIQESGLHIKSSITLEEFRENYEKFGKELDERDFAVEILRS